MIAISVIIEQYGNTVYRTVKVEIIPKLTCTPKIAAQKKQPISILHYEKYLY